jgi:hypothetical protein
MRSEIPIACSLSAAERGDRRAEFAALVRRGLIGRETTSSGLRLRFHGSPDLHAELIRLTGLEKECCPFFEFQLEDRGDTGELILDVGAPEGARAMVDELFSAELAR